MTHEFKFCPNCATPLAMVTEMEDGGEKARLRCPACGFTHWNNPTPVLAGVIEYQGKILLARNAAWTAKMPSSRARRRHMSSASSWLTSTVSSI